MKVGVGANQSFGTEAPQKQSRRKNYKPIGASASKIVFFPFFLLISILPWFTTNYNINHTISWTNIMSMFFCQIGVVRTLKAVTDSHWKLQIQSPRLQPG